MCSFFFLEKNCTRTVMANNFNGFSHDESVTKTMIDLTECESILVGKTENVNEELNESRANELVTTVSIINSYC